LVQVIALPDVKEKLASGALEPAPMSQNAFRKLIAEELTRWSAVVKTAGIRPE
jgi:tripartite-type tricarboxylate transporter receptor subunit TctC